MRGRASGAPGPRLLGSDDLRRAARGHGVGALGGRRVVLAAAGDQAQDVVDGAGALAQRQLEQDQGESEKGVHARTLPRLSATVPARYGGSTRPDGSRTLPALDLEGHPFQSSEPASFTARAAIRWTLMQQTAAFRHEVMLYDSPETFVEGAAPFIRDAVAAGEPIMVAIGAEKIALLRTWLGEDADWVVFADMAELGANPARIIPAWQDFLDANAASGRPCAGSASRSGPSAARPSWSSASATRRCSTSPSPTPRTST